MTDSKSQSLFLVYQVVSYVFWLLNVVLVFRFGLRLVGANPEAGFSEFIYSVSAPFVAPFLTVIPSTTIMKASVFEWQTLLAIGVYAIVAVAIMRLVNLSRSVTAKQVAPKGSENDPS